LGISRSFDRLAVESVLYQIFLVTAGLWSDPVGLDYNFDSEFWTDAERLLERSVLFPGQSNVLNSPVLGVPVTLFRLVLSLKGQYQRRWQHSQAALDQIKTEVQEWEALMLSDLELDWLSEDEQQNGKHIYNRDGSYLYILIASLLVEQLSRNERSAGPPHIAPSDSWQVRKAVQILGALQHDDSWANCYLGNWPVYTLGFFMNSPGDRALVRVDLQRRWELTKFGQVARFSHDLADTWAARKAGRGKTCAERLDIPLHSVVRDVRTSPEMRGAAHESPIVL
jgi:hypothetical protein